MNLQLVDANVVVVARQFNPTIFSQLWLVRNGIATEEDFQGESVFTPAFVQVRARRYALLVLAEQVQFAPSPPAVREGELVLDKVGRIVRLLPETPYVAVGLNFTWQLDIGEPDQFVPFSRALFFRGNPLFHQFDEVNGRFGGYLSREMFGARLKLDVKPIRVGPPEDPLERLLFAFNFHKDVGRDDPVQDIQEMLGRWNDALEESSAIVASLENWQWR
jgi:hypothetical protein